MVVTLFASFVAAAPLRARQPLSSPPNLRPPPYPHRLVVKFRDHVRVRVGKNGPQSLGNSSLVPLHQVLARHAARLHPLIDLPEEKLVALEERAAKRSGRAQPDLAGMLVVTAPETEQAELAVALDALETTEFVAFEQLKPAPPCFDIAPATGQFTNLQSYAGPNPGLNIEAARTLGNARGNGITFADCEYGFYEGHEDLCNIIVEPGYPIDYGQTNSYLWHGTATMGEMVALDNGYGCMGLVPDATARFHPEFSAVVGPRRAAAIASAIGAVAPGDIVMLEMQTYGPSTNYGPAELDLTVWTVVKTGTDGGVIIVAAAGNGDQDLDSAVYSEYRSRGDSGAIIVGAGSAGTGHNKLGFSTYGSRVNVQGWGQSVMTLGYGGHAAPGGDTINQGYRATFGGTSSATPFVAAAAVALQGLSVESIGRRLTPAEMRALLIVTGVPQGTGGHIGPFPDVLAAALAIPEMVATTWVDFNATGAQQGTFDEPYHTLAGGVEAAPEGGYIRIRAGSSPETMTINKVLTLKAYGGGVRIGE